ncbi:hypothetical protein M407DRAFT_244963 [Tulasnella calospora MUT 4182]|uniref:Uncharacterized protein n=1 Tax=Tulasnella calospora MUT 4182 TaxID=1051891 RepID=A0A0C3QDQ3_9AGAM|nr:hypothetical protein M407DRAFT_244963 [Tulasnella calospora MUT 4182]
MLESPHIGESNEGTVENPIVLDTISKVTLAQVMNFHKALSCRRYENVPTLSLQQWSDALHLASSWGFASLRIFIIQNIDALAQDPLSRIQMADECGIKEWLHPAYAKLCARKAPLTAEEGRILGFERYTALWRIREEDLKATADRSLWDGQKSPRGEKTISSADIPLIKCRSKCCQIAFELNTKEKGFLARIAKAKELEAR